MTEYPTLQAMAQQVQGAEPDRNGQEQKDIFAELASFRERQAADIPPRIWFVEGMITTGFNMLVAKKAMGKSWFLIQTANAIGDGLELLGRKTIQAKVLYVAFELDEGDTSDRFKNMLRPLSENAFVLHTWSGGDKAFNDTERAIKEHGFRVIMFDTFLPMLPRDPNFKLNEYGDSDYYLKWRLLGKRNGAAIVAAWHTGKADREDFFLNPIGSTGMVAQADSLITIDRKRGDAAGKIFVGGNHAQDAALPVLFEDGVFTLSEGVIDIDRLTPDEQKTMDFLSQYQDGCSTAAVALGLRKSEDAARMALNRLMARGRVSRVGRGIYAIATLLNRTERTGTEHVRNCSGT